MSISSPGLASNEARTGSGGRPFSTARSQSMSRDDAALLDVVNFARRIVLRTSGWTQEEFEGDELKHVTVLHLFTLLGESVRRLSDEFRLTHPEIPWARIVGMRNKLVHAYDA